ncbi:HAMP domain-containing sensor histidine kinase [Paenibacillus physcomitrellae]|uniref:histidine kinase n=1 Tax=Paenibacillus physcomitrellae TaxID=1619311 RepID=A0ABQ1GZN9_9BACL|nr:HAMP domain-containing sensor histidine kinase [Paenibacillus physcomitrellae]GGA53084.1 hypothetical protein GCM10010917_42880 [Paenibacillus physcomitrellae]
MSIRRKMILLFVFSLVTILVINMILIYSRARSNLRDMHETQLILLTKQAAVSLEQSRNSVAHFEQEQEKNLQRAAQTAASELGPEWSGVTVEQLADLSRRTGVSGFSLVYRKDNELMIGQSTDPQRLGAVVPQKLDSGSDLPLSVAGNKNVQMNVPYWADSGQLNTDGSFEEQNGFYYDGQRNYMICVFLRPEDLQNEFTEMGPSATIERIEQSDPNILEITGFRPLDDGAVLQEGASAVQHQILFGTYSLKDEEAELQIQEAAERGEAQVSNLFLDGQHYIQSYLPVSPPDGAPYILRMVYSYGPLSSGLEEQMVLHLLIFLFVLLLALLSTYFTSRTLMRPLRQILGKVQEMSAGRFDTRLYIKSHDELGVLAKHINHMADNLDQYTSELEQMNEENRSMREYLESVINQTADAIHLSDPDWRVIRVNRAFEELYGWSEDEVTGYQLPFVPSYVWEEWEEWEKMLAEGHALPSAETVRLCKDGSEVEVSISQSPIFDKNGTIIAYITISRDMTEHNKMQELLRQSEKLTTVGQLAAGVAHEIRNPLTTLRGFLQLQQQTQALNVQHVDIMLSELDRINLIVSEFLILAKPQASIFQNKDIRYVLGDVVSLLDSQAHLYGIEFVTDFAKEPIYVYCEENQLKQVFINILKNAMEAMPRGGGIGLKIIKENNQALIGIIDEGEGIPFERIAKLGEPFYTSKEKGTGLGLMISQRIIEAHKGDLNINSMVGWGTMVTITLPLVHPDGEGGEQPGPSLDSGKDQEE